MDLPYDPKRLPKELIVVGLLALLVASALTGWECSREYDGVRASRLAFLQIVCPASVAHARFLPSPWYALFAKLFGLWVLGGTVFLAGLVISIRDFWRERARRSRSVVVGSDIPVEAEPAIFGRKAATVRPPATYQLSPERLGLFALNTGVRDAIGRGDLDGALAMVERAVRECDDDRLTVATHHSRSAEIDWVTIVAAAIEADVFLKSIGEEGCRDIVLEMGALDEERALLYRRFFGPRPSQPGGQGIRSGGRAGAERGPVRQTIEISGIAELIGLERDNIWVADEAEQERMHLVSELAGMLLVLRTLDVIRRHATETGFPFAVTLYAGVASIGGEDAIRQRGPHLGLDLPCRVAPVGDEVAMCLERRFTVHGAEDRDAEATSLRNFRAHFMAKGWVDSRFIPMSMPEFTYFRGLGLKAFDPENRVSHEAFDALTKKIAAVMEAERAQSIDVTPYR